MELTGRIRWLALALPVALAAAASVVRPAPPGVLAGGPLPEHACAPGAARTAPDGAGPAWYRMDPVLGADGTLSAQRLTVGRGTARWSATLPAESFASGPVGGRVLVGDDDGQHSRLRLLDTGLGCWSTLGTTSDVIRSAILAPDGARLYDHRVARGTRRDLGTWQRVLGGHPAAALRVLPGLPEDAAYGPTFSTSLLVAGDGRLIESACGERACRTRVLDPATGAVATVNGTGPAAGLVGGRLVAFAPCDGLPCAVNAIDLASGTATPLDEADGPVVAAPDTAGVVVLADDGGLGVVRIGPGAADLHVPSADGLVPVVASSTASSGIEAPRGHIAVAPGGRVSDPSLVRFLDPAALQLSAGEVLP